MINTNLIHNVLNVAIVGLGAALLASGCVAAATPTGLDCSASWLSPQITTLAITVLGAAKVVMNIARDGFFGLFAKQPPVQK